MTQYAEAPITVTIKTGKGYEDAWLVLRGNNPVEIQSMLDAITSNGLGAVLGKADAAFKAEFIAGKKLGATPIEAPQNPAPPAQQENPWAASVPPQQQQAPAQQDPWGGYNQQAQAPAQQAQAQPQQAGTFGGDDSDAGAPLVLGMPAKRVTGVSKKTGKGWAAWADPRPQNMTQGITERTNDANDPRLAAGQATYWSFIRD